MARKGAVPAWPAASHTEKTWRAAREIIDWSIPGKSIFGRKKPLSKNTIRRIGVGIERFCGELAKPFLLMLYGTGTTRSVDVPLPTITAGGGRGGGHVALCQFVLQQQSGGVARSVSKPVPTIAASGAQALVDACLVQVNHGGGDSGRIHTLSEPLRTLASKNGFGLASFIVKYYGTGIAQDLGEPVPTITAKDRMGLVGIGRDTYGLDIRLRMLEPHELSAAMSFPKGYLFTGNRADKVRQIGNAWDVSLGRALCRKLLEAS